MKTCCASCARKKPVMTLDRFLSALSISSPTSGGGQLQAQIGSLHGLGDFQDTNSAAGDQAVIGRWKTKMAAQGLALRSKYQNLKVVYQATLLTDVTHWWTIATEFDKGAPDLHQLTDAQRTKARNNAVDLLELKAEIKGIGGGYMGAVVDSGTVARAVEKMIAPIDWLIAVGGPVLQTDAQYRETYRSLVKTATHAPGLLAKWGLDQVVAAVGLPKWLIPVVGVGVIGGLGFWAYQSFLAPITRASRVVSPNPRRRQGRRSHLRKRRSTT